MNDEPNVAGELSDPFSGLAEFTVGDQEYWRDCVIKNSNDGYSRGVITYAARWANLLENEIRRRELIPAGDPKDWSADEREAYLAGVIKVVNDEAERLSNDADTQGITGFMYGAAVHTLAHSWVHGDVLRRWHNKEYGAPDAEGTVNPAMITIGK